MDKFRYLFANKPLTLYYCITERCNSRCLQCSYWRKDHNVAKELTLEEIENIFTDLYDFGIRYVFIAGGEPLLRKDIWRVIGILSAIGFNVTLSTNGILLNGVSIKNLRKFKRLHIVISLDSIDRKTYRFLRGADELPVVLGNLALVKKHFGMAKVSVVISSLNYQHVDEIIQFCREKGYYASFYPYNAKHIMFASNTDLLAFDDKKEEMANVFKKLARLCLKERNIFGTSLIYSKAADWILDKEIGRCSAGYDFLYLGYDGTLYPCFGFLKPLGNLRQKKVKDIFVIDKVGITKCNKFYPCFLGCTRAIAIVREHKWDVIKEAVFDRKIWTLVKAF